MSTRWARALAEHESVVTACDTAIAAFTTERWHTPMGPGRWTPAALVVHICQSYDLGRDAMDGAPSMALRVSPLAAWVSRHTMLPLMLTLRRFPSGAQSPDEVLPDMAAAARLSIADARQRLALSSAQAVKAIARERAAGSRRFTHAYFGALGPMMTLRLVSAHTRHHTAGLRAAAASR